MKSIEKTLFVYSLIAISVVFVTSAIFNPKPQNLISSIALFPVLIFFWIRLTSPQEVSLPKWSARMLLTIVLLAVLGTYSYFLAHLANKDEDVMETTSEAQQSDLDRLKSELAAIEDKDDLNATVLAELEVIKEELRLLKGSDGADLSDVLVDLNRDPNTPLGYLEVVPTIASLDVLASPDYSAFRLTEIVPGNQFPFSEVDGDWYKITTTANIVGWVNKRDIVIVN